jgi:hypothetical protein
MESGALAGQGRGPFSPMGNSSTAPPIRRGFRSPRESRPQRWKPEASCLRFPAPLGGQRLCLLKPHGGGAVVLFVQLYPDVLATELLGRATSRTGTGEGVQHRALRRTESLDQRPQGREWFLRRVELVAGVRNAPSCITGCQWSSSPTRGRCGLAKSRRMAKPIFSLTHGVVLASASPDTWDFAIPLLHPLSSLSA